MSTLNYLSSPYFDAGKDEGIMDARFLTACRVAAQLLGAGVKVYSPVAHNVPLLKASAIKIDWPAWSALNLEILDRCDRLIVLKLEGWKQSTEVRNDMQFAERHQIPIEFVTEDDWMPRNGSEQQPG